MDNLPGRVVQLYQQGLDADYLAEWFDISVDQVKKWLAAPGIHLRALVEKKPEVDTKSQDPRPWSPSELLQIWEGKGRQGWERACAHWLRQQQKTFAQQDKNRAAKKVEVLSNNPSPELLQIWEKKEQEWVKARQIFNRKCARRSNRTWEKLGRQEEAKREQLTKATQKGRDRQEKARKAQQNKKLWEAQRAQIERQLHLKDLKKVHQENSEKLKSALSLLEPLDEIDLHLLEVDLNPSNPSYVPPIYPAGEPDEDDTQICGAHTIFRLHDHLSQLPAGYPMTEEEANLLVSGRTPPLAASAPVYPTASFRVCVVCGYAEAVPTEAVESDEDFFCSAFCEEVSATKFAPNVTERPTVCMTIPPKGWPSSPNL